MSVVAACDTSPGAAAVVGSGQITTSQLQSEVNTALADPVVKSALANPQTSQALGGNRVGFTRDTLTRLISERVVAAVALSHHVTVTPQEVNSQKASFVQQAGGLTALQQSAADQVGVGASQLESLLRFTVLQQKLGTALTSNLKATQAQLEGEYQKDIDNYDQLQVAQIAVTSKTLAQHILAQVKANPSSFAALASKDSTDAQSKSNGGLVGFVGRSQVLKLLGGKASEARPGSFVLAHAQGQYIVLHIIKRQTQPLSAVVDQVKAALFSNQANTLLGKAVSAEAAKLGIHVSPRYGRWDSKTQSVVPTTSPISSPG
jgi:parvulin-like peptidyl-prolyl isomerase